MLLTLTGCMIFSSITSGLEFKYHTFKNHNISLSVPVEWEIYKSPFFQLKATGKVKSISNITFEYRGLHKSLPGYQTRKEYTKGWYDAFILSYKNYHGIITSKSDFQQYPGIDSFQFIGEYIDPQSGILMARMGKLHFTHQNLHALYYTIPKKDFQKALPIIQLMESRHKFHLPQQ